MKTLPKFRRSRAAGTVLVALCATAVLAAGCSSSSGSTGTTPKPGGTSTNTAPATTKPANETFKIPQQVGIPPLSFMDADNKLAGVLPDLTNAIGEKLGLKVDNEPTAWENALLGVQRGVFNGAPGADITKERLLKFDFALIMNDHYGFLQKASSPAVADNMDALCGLSIGVTQGNSAVPVLEEQSKKCTDGGKKAITVKTFPDAAAVTLALSAGHIDASTDGMPTMAYQATQSNGKLRVTGPSYNFAKIGFAAPKGSGTAEKIADALNQLIADGTYHQIMAKYGLESTEMKKSEVNPEPLH